MKPFEQEMAFYTAYHQEPRNVMLHVLGVPLILYASMIPLSWLVLFHLGAIPVSLALVLGVGVLVYYARLDTIFAVAATVMFVLLLWAAGATAAQGAAVGWTVFIIGQVVGWVAQIFGHQYYEGRQPAFVDNLLQALVSAPLFVIADIFFFFGLRRDKAKALYAEVAALDQARDRQKEAC